VRVLQEQRARLVGEVTAQDTDLARVPWRKLRLETTSLESVVVQRKLSWSALLADLERVIPWDVRLTSIAPQTSSGNGISVVIDGIATGREAWLKLLARLFADRHFSDPMPSSEAAPGSENNAGYSFQIRVRYWPEGRS
jgi:Tfp pilus assembly protein PilN